MSTINPPMIPDADRPHHVFDWMAPGKVDGRALALRGSLDYEPPPESSLKPILIAPLVALALAGGMFWCARRRGESAPSRRRA